jgi:hypothetical protein
MRVMKSTTIGKSALIMLGVFTIFLGDLSTRGDGPADEKRRAFMRQKLEFSKQVLEGLTLEDFDAITKGARALKQLSLAAEWEVPTIPNLPEYMAFTNEFQRLGDDLSAQAKAKNIDGATLAYLRLTMNCVNCHKYVRFKTQ